MLKTTVKDIMPILYESLANAEITCNIERSEHNKARDEYKKAYKKWHSKQEKALKAVKQELESIKNNYTIKRTGWLFLKQKKVYSKSHLDNEVRRRIYSDHGFRESYTELYMYDYPVLGSDNFILRDEPSQPLTTIKHYTVYSSLKHLYKQISGMPPDAIVELTSCMLDDINLFRSVE